MKYTLAISLIFLVSAFSYKQTTATPRDSMMLRKVFNYQGPMPIKDDRTGELVKSDSNQTETSGLRPNNQAEAEAACWSLINEQSAVTFALQNRVLDELIVEMNGLIIEDELREDIVKITNRMRKNMEEASDALSRDAADEFFDALFDSSEDIIHLSSLIRDPKLDDQMFLALVKAVSRLGRNNSALIQEFTGMCSFVRRSPKPRNFESE